MAPKKPAPAAATGKKTRRNKSKNPTQKPHMQRVLVVAGSGKKKLVWRPW